MSTPTNTYQTYLMNSADGTTWKNICPVKSTPDLGKTPDNLDATTLSDAAKRYIEDILDSGGALEFDANYDPDDYEAILTHKGKEEHWAVWFGGKETEGVMVPDGHLGKFEFTGTVTAYPKSRSVSAVSEMTIAIMPLSEIKYVSGN